MVKSKKFHLIILGCQMNYSDAERLTTVLKKLGYQKTKQEADADLIAIIACSVKKAAVDRIHSKIHNWQLTKEKKPLVTILSGCVLESDKKKLAHQFDLFIDIKNLDNLKQELNKLKPEENLALPNFFEINPSYTSDYRAYIPIMTGCNNFCNYCAVPYTRGREKSRPSKDIIQEVKNLLTKGYKEIILLGQNVNSYGKDLKTEMKFPELLKKVDTLGENYWLKFLTSHPYDMSDDLIKVMVECQNLNDYLHLPVQSGSNKILKKMNRHYTKVEFMKLIQKINKALPNITLSTDIIVGFCSETEQDFKATQKLLKDSHFNLAYISQYSPRIGTNAEKMYPDDITKKIKKQRWQTLNSQLLKQSLTFNQALIGQEQQALIDVVKKDKTTFINIGKLSNFIPVHIIDKQALKVGQFYQVRIIKALNWGVKAELVNEK